MSNNRIIASYYPAHRRPEFQLRTQIISPQSTSQPQPSPQSAIKTAITPVAQDHLQNLIANTKLLAQTYPQLEQPTLLSATKTSATFSHLPYPTLTQLIENSLFQKDFSAIIPLFEQYLSIFQNFHQAPFQPYQNQSFVQIFDPQLKHHSDHSYNSLSLSLLDLTCSNLLFNSQTSTFYLIDQEWLFHFSLPLDFLLFRNLFDLCSRLQPTIQNLCSKSLPCYQLTTHFLIPQTWFDFFQLSFPHLTRFYAWEHNFQTYCNQNSPLLPSLLLAQDQLPLLTQTPPPKSASLYQRLLEKNHALETDYQNLVQSHQELLKTSHLLQSLPLKLLLRPRYYLTRFFSQEKNFIRQNGFSAYYPRLKNRSARRRFLRQIQQTSTSPSSSPQQLSELQVLIIAGATQTVSHIHRVDHLIEKLELLQVQYQVIDSTQLALHPDPASLCQKYHLLFIHRAISDPNLDALTQVFRTQNKPVLFDIDDLVFDPEILPTIAQTQNLSLVETQIYSQTMSKHQSIIRQATHLLAPTNYLCSALHNFFDLPTFQLPNHLDAQSFSQGQEIASLNLSLLKKLQAPSSSLSSPSPLSPSSPSSSVRSQKSSPLLLGYFPGTKTHDQDFLVVAPALVYLFRHFSPREVQLHITGFLSLPPILEPYLHTGHLHHHPAVPYPQLIKQYSPLHLNLAPLHSATDPFCSAKSELKYFFAGICGVPTLATPTAPYQEIHDTHHSLLLCSQPQDWLSSLLHLLHHPKDLLSLGEKAYHHCSQTYSPALQAQNYLAPLLEKLLTEYFPGESSPSTTNST